MYRTFYEGLNALAWVPQATMVFFLAVFFAVLIWAVHNDFERVAALALDDEEKRS